MQDKRIENLFSIHIGAIIALLVFNHIANVAAADDGVAARNAAIIGQGNIIRRQATNGHFIFVQPIFFQLPICSSQNKPGRTLLRAWSNQCRVVRAWWLVVLRLHTSFLPQSTLL
jgi:hypothetical protein